MTTTVIHRDFKSNQLWRNRYRRSRNQPFEVWDANLHHGDIRPFACPDKRCDDKPHQTLYPLRQCECAGFADVRDAVHGFCFGQHFHIDGDILRQVTESALCAEEVGCRAGAPVPARPSASSSCGGCDAVGVAYVVTYVTEHSGVRVESAPSPISGVVASSGNGGNISWGAPPAGFCVVATRIYRTEGTFEDGTDGFVPDGAEFVLVGEVVGGGAGSHSDGLAPDETGEVLDTYDPMAFPAPTGLVSLCRTADGIAVADTHRVYISLPGKPQFTWDGVVEVEDEIRKIAAVGNNIFVFTDNRPVKIGYTHTDGIMSVERRVIDRRLPLASVRSVSVYDDKVYFSSSYSLYAWDIGGYGADINAEVTPLLTPEQWLNIGPESVVGTAYEFGYIFSSDKMDYSLMVEFGNDGTDTVNNTSLMPISYINPEAFGLDYDGHIMYQEGGSIYRWDWRRDTCNDFVVHDHVRPTACEQCECCPWKFVLYFDNEGKNRFSKMRVEWDERSYSHIDLGFYAHQFGNESPIVEDMKIISSRAFSLPKFCSYQTYRAELSSCAIMHEVRLATSNEELALTSPNLLEADDG